MRHTDVGIHELATDEIDETCVVGGLVMVPTEMRRSRTIILTRMITTNIMAGRYGKSGSMLATVDVGTFAQRNRKIVAQ